ncbi:MAG: DUF4293 domain-containing protein [Muribaculaceae bacterium]|nr:DUF4293 domain-containing protein [Muribaculaceae bacterium]
MVIQRWQTVLLFVAAAVMACFTFLPIAEVVTPDYTFSFNALGFYQEGIPTNGETPIVVHTWYFFMLSITTIVLLLVDIFLYRNLRLQQRVCMVALLFIVADACVCGLLGFWSFRLDEGHIWWKTSIICPLIAILATIFAYYRMAQDYSLLKAADRLR